MLRSRWATRSDESSCNHPKRRRSRRLNFPTGVAGGTYQFAGLATLLAGTATRLTFTRATPRTRAADVELAKLEVPIYVTGRVRRRFSDMRVPSQPESIDHREVICVR